MNLFDLQLSSWALAGYGILLVFAYLLSRLAYHTLVFYPLRSPLANLKGPSRPSLLKGNFEDVFNNPGGPGNAYAEWYSKYGRVFRFALFGGSERVACFDPVACTKILVTDSYSFRKPTDIAEGLSRLVGPGILLAEGDVHRKQKRILGPAMNVVNVNAMLPIFFDKAETLRNRLNDAVVNAGGKSKEDVAAWTAKTTMDIIGSAGLGVEFDSLNDGNHPLAVAFADLFGDSLSSTMTAATFFLSLKFPWVVHLPTEDSRRNKKIASVMHEESVKILELAKAAAIDDEKAARKDLIGLLVKANVSAQEEKQRLTDEEVMGQMSTFILAGFETTGTALSWCLYELARNVDVQNKLRKELREAQANVASEDGRLSLEQLTSLPYLDAVTKETLRLRTPVPNTTRTPFEDVVLPLSAPIELSNGKTVDSLFVPKDTHVMIPIWAINCSEEIWGPTAKSFRPERWEADLPDSVASATHGFTLYSHLLTFLSGPRGCIGWRFALLEFKAVLATFILTLKVEETEEKPEIQGKAFVVTKPYLPDDPTFSQLPLNVSLAD